MEIRCHNCGLIGATWSHVENCKEGFVEQPCPTCAALSRAEAAEAEVEVWREKKRVLENDLGKAWEENKRLREAVDLVANIDKSVFQNDDGMIVIPFTPTWFAIRCELMGLAELRRRAGRGNEQH